MTEDEACAEAKRRWGKQGNVFYDPDAHPSERYVVGYTKDGVYEVVATGTSWEDAFYWIRRNEELQQQSRDKRDE